MVVESKSPVRRSLLDANVVSYFFQANAQKWLAEIAQVAPLVIVEEVRDELQGGAHGAQFKNWLAATPAVEVRGLMIAGSGAATYAKLREGVASLKDAGEHASIALASEASSLVFVTNDRNAAWLALGEFLDANERVVKFSTFLRRSALVVPTSASMLRALATKAQLIHRPPTWWSSWVESL